MFLGFVGDDLLKVNGGYFCIGVVFASWGYFCSFVMWTEGCKTKIIMTAQEWLSCEGSSWKWKRAATRRDVPWLCWWWSSESEWGLLLHWGCFCKLGLLLQFCHVNWRLQNKNHNDCPGVAILWRLLLEMEKGSHQVWCSLALLVMVFWRWIGVTVAFLFLRLSTVPERKAPPERRHSCGFRWLRSFGALMFLLVLLLHKVAQVVFGFHFFYGSLSFEIHGGTGLESLILTSEICILERWLVSAIFLGLLLQFIKMFEQTQKLWKSSWVGMVFFACQRKWPAELYLKKIGTIRKKEKSAQSCCFFLGLLLQRCFSLRIFASVGVKIFLKKYLLTNELLKVYGKFACKVSMVPWKFMANLHAKFQPPPEGLHAKFQPHPESLQWNFQGHPASFI